MIQNAHRAKFWKCRIYEILLMFVNYTSWKKIVISFLSYHEHDEHRHCFFIWTIVLIFRCIHFDDHFHAKTFNKKFVNRVRKRVKNNIVFDSNIISTSIVFFLINWVDIDLYIYLNVRCRLSFYRLFVSTWLMKYIHKNVFDLIRMQKWFKLLNSRIAHLRRK